MSEPFSILVVDDNPPSVETLAAVLDARGFIVHTATSGTKALEILRDYQVDILLTDVKMPDMNGVELFRETKKSRPASSEIKTASQPCSSSSRVAMRCRAHYYRRLIARSAGG